MFVNLKIGDMVFSVETEQDFPWTEDVKVFRRFENGDPTDLHYKIEFVNDFAPLWGSVVYQDSSMIVMNSDNVEHRVHFLANAKEPYALTIHQNNNFVQIYINDCLKPYIKWDRNLIGLFSLEHFCLQHRCFLLHASYIIYNGKAIIFTAPSGTGKSTQADLWHKYAGAEIINGDRTLLMYDGEKWFACGFPVCGSSEYCKDKMAPIHSVICLAQGVENRIEKLSAIDAWKKLYSQSFVNKWNSGDCEIISSYITSLVQFVPVYSYSCTKEKDAVDVLKDYLEI